MCCSLDSGLLEVRVEEMKKMRCDLLDGIWKIVMMTLDLLSYLMKGSIVKIYGEK